MYYFAYGSNLSSKFMRKYCPSASFVMRADLPNYHIEFRHYSTELHGGISSIIEAPGELVQGVIFDVPESEIGEMDILESVPEGLYRREQFLVWGEDGIHHRVDLYRVTEPKGPFAPAKSYVDLMIDGAREHGLPPEYVAKLISFLPDET